MHRNRISPQVESLTLHDGLDLRTEGTGEVLTL